MLLSIFALLGTLQLHHLHTAIYTPDTTTTAITATTTITTRGKL
jgi:hypothetical protein